MIKKIKFILIYSVFIIFYIEAKQDCFTNDYKMSIDDSLNNECIAGEELYESIVKNYVNKKYSKFYAIMQAQLEEAKKDGTWNKYLEYHQNVLYKQPGRTDKNKKIVRELTKERDLKLLALCQENSDLAICKIIRNITSQNEELQEATVYLYDILCKNIPVDNSFMNELYEILVVFKFYEASIFFKDWINKNLISQIIPLGLTVNTRLEAMLVLNLEMLNKISKLLEKDVENSASKHIQFIVNHKEAYLSNEYDKKFLMEIALGRRAPGNEIEKKAGELVLEYAIKKNELFRAVGGCE